MANESRTRQRQRYEVEGVPRVRPYEITARGPAGQQPHSAELVVLCLAAATLMRQSWAPERRPLRLIRVRLTGFVPATEFRQPPVRLIHD